MISRLLIYFAGSTCCFALFVRQVGSPGSALERRVLLRHGAPLLSFRRLYKWLTKSQVLTIFYNLLVAGAARIVFRGVGKVLKLNFQAVIKSMDDSSACGQWGSAGSPANPGRLR